MELTWPMKIRLAAVIAVGILGIGALGFNLVSPDQPMGMVVCPGPVNIILLTIMSFAAGLVCYFISQPWGFHIGMIATPIGMSVWAFRNGTMATAMQATASYQQRYDIYQSLQFQSLCWIVIVLAGFAGVYLAHIINPKTDKSPIPQKTSKINTSAIINSLLAIAATVMITFIIIRIFACDVLYNDSNTPVINKVFAQPAKGQIFFAVALSFGLAAYLAKQYMNAGYIGPCLASALVTFASIKLYVNKDVIEQMTQYWPPTFFTSVLLSITPLEMVAFGCLGAITGYWLAVRYHYWKTHQAD